MPSIEWIVKVQCLAIRRGGRDARFREQGSNLRPQGQSLMSCRLNDPGSVGGRHGNRTHLSRIKSPLRHPDANLPIGTGAPAIALFAARERLVSCLRSSLQNFGEPLARRPLLRSGDTIVFPRGFAPNPSRSCAATLVPSGRGYA